VAHLKSVSMNWGWRVLRECCGERRQTFWLYYDPASKQAYYITPKWSTKQAYYKTLRWPGTSRRFAEMVLWIYTRHGHKLSFWDCFWQRKTGRLLVFEKRSSWWWTV
jgi:hypothetical protein